MIAFRAHGNIFDFAVTQLFEQAHVVERFFGQIALRSATRNVAMPALHLFQNGLAAIEHVGKRKFVYRLPVAFISRADLDFVEIGKDVELGQRDLVRALDRKSVV